MTASLRNSAAPRGRPAESVEFPEAQPPRPEPPASGKRVRRPLAGPLLAVAFVAALGWLRPGPWASGVAALLTLAMMAGSGRRRDQVWIATTTVGVLVSTVDYLVWRVTVANWSAAWLAVPLLAAEAFGALHALGLQATIWPRTPPPLRRIDDPARFPIYVLIPTAGESMAVLGPTVTGALAARTEFLRRHPGARVHVIVCNDGRVAGNPTWKDVENSVRDLGVSCITRTVGGGAKAGNIESVRARVGATGDALVAVFDADMVPTADFLLATVQPFADPSVGWVQTAQYYRNTELPAARWAADQQALFYDVLCPGKAARNASFICGTNVVIRAAALDSIGGLPQNSVTEDFAASIRLAPDWRGVYLPGRFAEGLGPVDAASYLKQQNRWARGTFEVLKTRGKDLLDPRSGLTGAQRLQYGLACTHYLSGLRDLVYLLTPIIFVTSGIPAIRGADTTGFLTHFGPFFLFGQTAFWSAAKGRSTWRGIVAGFISFPALVAATLTVALGAHSSFTVTAKQRGGSVSWRPIVPHLAALLLCGYGLTVAVLGGLSARDLIACVWIGYMAAMLAVFCGLTISDMVRRADTGSARAGGRQPGGGFPVALRLAAAGLCVVAFALAIQVRPRTSAPVRLSPTPCATGMRTGLAVTAGAAVGYARLATRLRMTGISARTVEIGAGFPTSWADQVRATGGIPWLTLVFTRDGASSLDAALPAIVNAVQDDSLRRWARQIAAWGHPLYLTALPSVDRNYAASSAVANGGVPADSARAWRHIRRVFAAAHADNIAWTWQPAAPAGDTLYRPPAGQIDVVAVTWIQYPGTRWVSPVRELARVRSAYPSKPLLVTLAAAGTRARTSAWIGAAVRAARSQRVLGLVYQTDGPDPHASRAAFAAWRAGAYLTAAVLRTRENRANLSDGAAAGADAAGAPGRDGCGAWS
ncbi:glycosyltransferase [Frankia sp. AgB32]|uniref:glycosyltransferase n=1 Tax=Frankia sp. AgB32 TaxID=631119 RepID=UPI00200E62F7|nr:glycosyltransferase [Frankia sp. AgB32]MCK9893716.1 glycosyltransferase [Frankia sp. AgB32]